MSDEISRQLDTEEQRQRLHAARRGGGMCAACGRNLIEGETVWQEQFAAPAPWRFAQLAPVGVECVSESFLAETERVEPERCVWCGRGVHYPPAAVKPGRRRTRAMCSRRCGNRASVAKYGAKRAPTDEQQPDGEASA